MQIVKNMLALLFSLSLFTAGHISHASEQQSLFINLTSNEINRAAMAINFGHRVLQKKKLSVTLFLNVDGVHLVNKHMPQNKHSNGKTVHEMLAVFMRDGGRVIVCPMCMKNVGGMQQADLIDGVLMGGPDTTWKALFADDVTVLSY